MKRHLAASLCVSWLTLCQPAASWIITPPTHRAGSLPARTVGASAAAATATATVGTALAANRHGENSCFMPLKQLDQDYYAPRIVQVAGTYPGITKEEVLALPPAEPSPDQGQWLYDFCDPEQSAGRVAIEGSQLVHAAEDPIVIVAEHTSLNIPLPKELQAVDLIVLVDRANQRFGERRFLVMDTPQQGIVIGAYAAKADLPVGAEILGQVVMVQIPWLPSMAPTKSGFMEVDEYF